MRAELMHVMEHFLDEAKRPLKGSLMAKFIRHELPAAVRVAVGDELSDIEIEGHPGQGGWTATPWIGFMNPAITATPEEGVYACLLFQADMQGLVLSLQIGTERLRKAHPKEEAFRALDIQRERYRRDIRGWQERFSAADVEFQGPNTKTARAESHGQASRIWMHVPARVAHRGGDGRRRERDGPAQQATCR